MYTNCYAFTIHQRCRHFGTVYTPVHHATVHTRAHIVLLVQTSCYSLLTCTSCYSSYTCSHCLTCRHHATVYTPAHFVVFTRSEWLCLLLSVASPLPLFLSLPCLPLYGYGCPAFLQFQKTTAKKNHNYLGLSRIYVPCMTPADFLITWWLDRLMQSTNAGVMSTWNQLVHSIMSVVVCVCVCVWCYHISCTLDPCGP